jgi:hypothetical protein
MVLGIESDSSCYGLLELRRSLGCPVGAMLHEELCEIQMAIERRHIQRSRPVLVLGFHIGAMLDEEPCEIHMTLSLLRRPMERSQPIVVRGFYICAVLYEEPCEIHTTIK